MTQMPLPNPSAGLVQLKVGAGVVGNNTYIFVAGVSAAAVLGWALSAHPYVAIGAVAIVVVATLVFMGANLWMGHRHPDQAMMGDSNWLKLREMQFGAKDALPGPRDSGNPAPVIDQ